LLAVGVGTIVIPVNETLPVIVPPAEDISLASTSSASFLISLGIAIPFMLSGYLRP
jgi:hypothetical protein